MVAKSFVMGYVNTMEVFLTLSLPHTKYWLAMFLPLYPVPRHLSRKVLPFLGQNHSRHHAKGLTVWKWCGPKFRPIARLCFTSKEVARFSDV